MQFNEITNLSGAIQECEAWLFGGNYGAISGNPILLNRFTALLNSGLNDTTSEILKADGKWQHDSNTFTNLPEGTTDLANAIANYTLDLSHLKVQGVEIKNKVGDYVPVYQIDYREIRQSGHTETEFFSQPGLPLYYDIKGDQLVLFPAPKTSDVTLADGLKVIYQREPNYFISTDTTKTTGLPKLYEMLPVLFACNAYAKQNVMTEKARELDNEIIKRIDNIKGFFNARNVDKKKSLRPAYRSAM